MKVLILGGTQFVGRHIAETALARGHEVTLFNRGQRNPDLFPDVEKLQGDRAGDLAALRGRSWDAVIDTSGYIPRHVRNSAMVAAKSAEHYTFISTISVYAEPHAAGADESAPLATIAPDHYEMGEVRGDSYGALKVLCEQAAADAMPGRVLTLRLGLMVGPYDHTDRFTYWVLRGADDGYPTMVIPANPDAIPMQVIDTRDMARFALDRIEARESGIYNTTGPDYPLTLGKVLESAETVTGAHPAYVEVDEKTLLDAGVTPWVDLPLWLPAADANIHRVSNQKAIEAGLTFLPLEQTMRDILEWRSTLAEPLKAGWNREREAVVSAMVSTRDGKR